MLRSLRDDASGGERFHRGDEGRLREGVFVDDRPGEHRAQRPEAGRRQLFADQHEAPEGRAPAELAMLEGRARPVQVGDRVVLEKRRERERVEPHGVGARPRGRDRW